MDVFYYASGGLMLSDDEAVIDGPYEPAGRRYVLVLKVANVWRARRERSFIDLEIWMTPIRS